MSVASLVPEAVDTTLVVFGPACAAEGANAVSVSAATVASAATRADDAIGPFRLNISNFLSWIAWPRRPVVANLRAKPGFLQTGALRRNKRCHLSFRLQGVLLRYAAPPWGWRGG